MVAIYKFGYIRPFCGCTVLGGTVNMKKPFARIVALILVLSFLASGVAALADYGAILNKNGKIYADAKMSKSLGTIPKYISVGVKSVKSGKAKINFRGYTVYVRSKYLSRPWIDFQKKRRKQGIDHLEDCLRYVKRSCYVYDYPSTSAKKLARVKKGRILTGFKEKGGWSIVMDSSETYYGYIKTSNLEGIGGGDGVHYPLG